MIRSHMVNLHRQVMHRLLEKATLVLNSKKAMIANLAVCSVRPYAPSDPSGKHFRSCVMELTWLFPHVVTHMRALPWLSTSLVRLFYSCGPRSKVFAVLVLVRREGLPSTELRRARCKYEAEHLSASMKVFHVRHGKLQFCAAVDTTS